MANRPLLVVRLRVDPSHEEAFTRWYHHEYLDTLMPIASRPCQRVPLHQQVPSRWTAAITR